MKKTKQEPPNSRQLELKPTELVGMLAALVPTSRYPFLNGRWLVRLLSNATHRVIDAALPQACAACRNNSARTLFCAQCWPTPVGTRMRRLEFDGQALLAYAPFDYNQQVQQAVHRFKFQSHPELARRMGISMLSALPRPLTKDTNWIPVPLSSHALVERGFNQSALLANELAHQTLSLSVPRLLLRKAGTSQQSRLNRQERLSNLTDAFTTRTDMLGRCKGSRIVLVDDVLTTGATALACARQLKRVGLSPEAVVTLAQVE